MQNCLKNCAKWFLSELRQISANFDNFWQKDGKEAYVLKSVYMGLTSSINSDNFEPKCYMNL